MITPEQVEQLWDEFCSCFPQIAGKHNQVARFAYLAGFRAALDYGLPGPDLEETKEAFELVMFQTAIAIKERKRPHLDRGEIIGHGPN